MTEPDQVRRLAEKIAAEAPSADPHGSTAGNGSPSEQQVRWKRAVEIGRRRPEFAWEHRLLLHDLNLAVGSEGAGKGILVARLATELTTGRLLGHPVSVAYGSVEENLEMVRMRLEAAGADLERVMVLPMGTVGLPGAIPALVASMQQDGIAWLFLDPTNAHFSSGLDPMKAKDVGIVLGTLAKVATECHLTVVGTLHTNRGGAMTARERYAHSLEFRRRARCSVIIGNLPDAEDHERVIFHDKHNYSLQDPALSATIRSVPLVVDGEPSSFPVLELGGEIDADAADLFVAEADREGAIAKAKTARGKSAAAAHHIRKIWEHLGRPAAEEAGAFKEIAEIYGKDAAARARGILKVRTEPIRGEDGRIVGNRWLFPDQLEIPGAS